MRILQVNTSDLGGGSQIVSGRLARGYRARGHESSLGVGFRYGEDPETFVIPNDALRPPLARAAARAKQRLARVPVPYAAQAGDALALAAEPRRARSVLRGLEDFDFPGTAALFDAAPWQPDVLHLHNLHGGYFDLRCLPGLTAAVPTLVTMHDAWLLTGHCAHALRGERWRSGCHSCPDLDVYPAIRRDATHLNWRRKGAIYTRSRLWVATAGRWLAERVPESILAQAAVEVRVIPQGADLRIYSPGDRAAARRELGIDADTFVALFAANFTRGNPFKDVATIEGAVERVAAAIERPTLLLCVGESLPDRVVGNATLRFVAPVAPPERLVPYYRAADVYLHAAKAETFPNTVVEALACGTPVIATAVGGVPEQVEDGVTGRLVPAADAEAMAVATLEVAGDEPKLAAMGRAAADYARRELDFERTVDAYVGLLEEIAAETPARD
jgi:glycosyltransferase involved in cell wall biosynthesis